MQLARFSDLQTAIFGRCIYYYATGDDDALLEVVRQGKRSVDNAAVCDGYECDLLYRRKQFDEVLARLQASRSSNASWHVITQAIVLATLERTVEAERLLLDARDPSGAIAGYLYFLGPGARTDPRQAARDILNQSSNRIPDWRGGWYHDLVNFNAGQMDAAELMAKAGQSRFSQCEACFYIGLHKLHERKRAEAKAWFQKSVDTGVYLYGAYIWSRAFLACIDDPTWLPWAVEKQ